LAPRPHPSTRARLVLVAMQLVAMPRGCRRVSHELFFA